MAFALRHTEVWLCDSSSSTNREFPCAQSVQRILTAVAVAEILRK